MFSIYSAKYSTDCFLKYRKWNLQKSRQDNQHLHQQKFPIKDILSECVENIDKYNADKTQSWSPIHLAALLNDVDALKILIQGKGIDVDILYTTPMYHVTPLACAAYAGGIESVEFLIASGAGILKFAKSLIHWTVKGGNIDCLIRFFEMEGFHEHPLDLCSLIAKDAIGDNVEILRIILKYYPTAPFKENNSRETTVYLAAGKGSKNLLRELVKSGVSTNKNNMFKLTPLHSAILKNFSDEVAFKCIETLLENGAQPNNRQSERAPLYHAAIRGFSKCVFTLINHGGIIDLQTLKVLNEKIPNFVQKHLDGLITLRGLSNSYSKTLVSMNLRFTGSMNFNQRNMRETSFLKFLIEDGQHKFLHHPLIETYLIVKWIVVQKFFFASFTLYVSMLIFFSSFVMVSYTDSGSLTNSVSLLYGGGTINNETNYTHTVEADIDRNPLSFIWYLSLTSVLLRAITNTISLSNNPRRYVSKFENYIQWVIIILMVITHIPLKNKSNENPEWQITVSAMAAFGSWAFLLNYLRRQPTLGIYVEMLYKVITNLLKLMLTFISLLIGFTISFMILYKGEQPFANLPHSMLRVFNMMVGEMGFDTLFGYGTTENKNEGISENRESMPPYENQPRNTASYPRTTAIHLLYAIFVCTISIALINLLIGLAVSDIKGLRKRSKLSKTLMEIAFISELEDFIFSRNVNLWLHQTISKYLKRSIQLPAVYHTLLDTSLTTGQSKNSTATPTVITKIKNVFTGGMSRSEQLGDMRTVHIYPNDSNDKRLPKSLKQEALQIAIRNNLEEDGKLDNVNQLKVQLSNIEVQLDFLIKRKQEK